MICIDVQHSISENMLLTVILALVVRHPNTETNKSNIGKNNIDINSSNSALNV